MLDFPAQSTEVRRGSGNQNYRDVKSDKRKYRSDDNRGLSQLHGAHPRGAQDNQFAVGNHAVVSEQRDGEQRNGRNNRQIAGNQRQRQAHEQPD